MSFLPCLHTVTFPCTIKSCTRQHSHTHSLGFCATTPPHPHSPFIAPLLCLAQTGTYGHKQSRGQALQDQGARKDEEEHLSDTNGETQKVSTFLLPASPLFRLVLSFSPPYLPPSHPHVLASRFPLVHSLLPSARLLFSCCTINFQMSL